MTFRGTALNPSCDAPGCHARAENPGPGGKDYCGKHAAGRPLSSPSAERLNQSTARLAASNDALERKVGGLPLPAAVAVAALDLSDEQRLAVCRELNQRWYRTGAVHLDQVMASYEREARERLGKR
jgi:hypothetical protein